MDDTSDTYTHISNSPCSGVTEKITLLSSPFRPLNFALGWCSNKQNPSPSLQIMVGWQGSNIGYYSGKLRLPLTWAGGSHSGANDNDHNDDDKQNHRKLINYSSNRLIEKLFTGSTTTWWNLEEETPRPKYSLSPEMGTTGTGSLASVNVSSCLGCDRHVGMCSQHSLVIFSGASEVYLFRKGTMRKRVPTLPKRN